MSPSTSERWLYWITSGAILWFILSGLLPWMIPDPIDGVPALFVAGLVAMLSHELAHVLAARMVGLRLVELGLGPIRIFWDGTGLSLSRSRRNPFGAYFVPAPVNDRRIRERFLISMAGGPLGNLAVGGVAYALYLQSPSRNPPTAGTEVLHSSAFLFLAISLVCVASGVTNLLPFRGSPKDGIKDGRYLIDFLRAGPNVQRLCALARLDGQNRVLAKMPEEWDAQRVREATDFRDASSSTLLALTYGYMHSLETDLERAAIYLDQAIEVLEAWPQKEWRWLYGSKAIFEAYYRNDMESAKKWVVRAGSDVKEYMRHEIAAIFLLKEGRGEDALREIQLGRQEYSIETKHEAFSGVAKSAERWFARLEAEADSMVDNEMRPSGSGNT